MNTYQEAAAQLPADAKWSSSFGNPGEGGYIECHRQPDGTCWIIGNGPWHLIDECKFDWYCQKVEG